jgi:uroporphyrinogen-III decarboxylase
MNARERFIATLKFEKVDRPFRWEAPAVWPATIKQWHGEGLPEHITCSNITDSEVYDYFDMDKLVWLPFEGGWIGDPYYPFFDYQVLADEGGKLVIRDTDGITKRVLKEDADTSMPQFLKFPVTDRATYESEIKWRLDPASDERFPQNWAALVEEYKTRDYPLGMFVIGPFGHIRNLFGDEELMYVFYDDPKLVRDIMADWAEFYKQFISRVCADVAPDFIMIWEDMCYRSGPLISPEFYREFMLPYLKQVIDTAKACGIPGIAVDNDGDCSKMLPLYLECGANAFYPFEVQAGMDIIEIRKQYGKRFVIIGGLDKKALAVGEAAIREELDKKMPFMLESGGYIPMLDHSVPTNVSLAMFRYYLEYARALGEGAR